jgi:hypothetical protein
MVPPHAMIDGGFDAVLSGWCSYHFAAWLALAVANRWHLAHDYP